MAPSHYLNQCWNIVYWTLWNKFQWNFNRNSNIFFHENEVESVVCEMASILSWPQCVNGKVCFLFLSNWNIFYRDIANSIFDLENSMSMPSAQLRCTFFCSVVIGHIFFLRLDNSFLRYNKLNVGSWQERRLKCRNTLGGLEISICHQVVNTL